MFFFILLWARAREREPGQGAKNMIVDFFVFCEQELAARRLRAAKKNQGAAVGVPHTAVYVIQAHSVADVSLLCCSALCGSVRLFFWLFVGLFFWIFLAKRSARAHDGRLCDFLSYIFILVRRSARAARGRVLRVFHFYSHFYFYFIFIIRTGGASTRRA
jgi:hypothetical protein